MVWDLAQGMITTIQGVFTPFQIEASRQEFQTDVEVFRTASQFVLEASRQEFQTDLEASRQEFQKDVEILRTASQFALQGRQQDFQTDVEIFRTASQFALQGKQQEFQAALEGVRQKHSKEMEAYRQYCENARLQKRQDFEREQLTRRLQHEQRLEEYRRETQLILSRLQLLMGIELADDKQIRDTFPLKTPARVILEAYKGYQESYRNIPLLVIISPPALEFEKFPNAAQGFSKIEVSLTDKVQEFGKYYPLTSQERPVRYQGADWESKSSHGKSAVDILHHVLNSIPTVVLESKVDGDLLRIYLAGWDMLEKVPHYEKVLTIPWKDVLYPIARKYAQEWREHRMKLLEKGRSLEDIKRRGGDDELNLLILEEEEEDQEFGRSGQHDYKYNVREDKYIRELAQFLGICHCILVGLMADRYHFSHGDVRPKLPELLPGLLEKVPSDSLKEMLVGEIVSSYQNLYQLTGVDRPHLIPYLFLDLALSLSYLPDKSWARKQIEYSLLSWLKLRNLVDSFAEQKGGLLDLLLEAFISALIMADVEYTEKLNGCLAAIGESYHQETIRNAIQGEQNAEYQRQLEAERLRQEEEAKRQRQLEEEAERLRQSKYQQLEGFLAAANWQKADQETARMMLKVMGKEYTNYSMWCNLMCTKYNMNVYMYSCFYENAKARIIDEYRIVEDKEAKVIDQYVSVEDIENFPSEDLRIIDQLWVKYSDGRFGFSVQKRIYQSLGGTREYDEKIFGIFRDRVDWYELGYKQGNNWGMISWDIQYKYNAPVGHLPTLCEERYSSHNILLFTNDKSPLLMALLSRPDL
ncbi:MULTISPECIES: GUN4 domain-containing protein [Planktothrix]|uniref:GUN4 domain-containing protein n=1 Tax=Planktothrix TaxID=54304 RepID=UPI000418F6D6